MSQENVEAMRGVRTALRPLSGRASQRRAPEERLFVHVPAIYRLFAERVLRLPTHSRVRRLMVARMMQRGYAAGNRRDFDLLLMGLDPGIEYHPSANLMAPDLEAVLYGHDGYLKVWRRWLDAFEDFRFEPEGFLDLGDKLLVTVQLRAHGSDSGVPVSQPGFQLFKFRRGLVVWQHDFGDRSEALAAAGLRE